MDAGLELRTITDDEIPAFRDELMATFGADPGADPEGPTRMRATVPPGRGLGVFDRGELVATAATFALPLAVPGGEVAMAGLTMVTVRATHRRRGILRALIDAHLDGARAHAEPVSGLWASEAGIYGRFGYGLAAASDRLAFDARTVRLAAGDALDEVRYGDGDELRAAVPAVYARARRPGWYGRTAAWWEHRRFVEIMPSGGATARRYAVAWRDGAATGYVAYRLRLAWDDGVADGAAEVDELIALDGRAERTLWRYVAALDLYPRVSYWNAPVDTVVPWLADDPRRIRRVATDALWLRIGDVAAALAARRYAADGALALAVTGGGGDDATVALRVEGGAATCAPTDRAPELRIDRAALGAIYLGGVTPSRLARAGRIAGTDAAVAAADRLFPWPVAPWCPEVF